MTTALLVIDVQTILCKGAHEVFESERIIGRINSIARRARENEVPVVLIQHETVGGEMDYDTESWKLASGLEVSPVDIHVRKRATDSFHNTELQALLQARGVKELVICGFQSDFCVDTTTRRALALGYSVTLVADGHSTMDNEVLSAAQITAHHNVTLANITSFGPRAKTISAIDVTFDRGRVQIVGTSNP
jgi:nicotinamidase-related amidase